MRIPPMAQVCFGLLCGSLTFIAGCGNPSSQSLASLTVTATPSTLSVGGAAVLKAVAHLSDGTTQDATAGTQWTLSNPALAKMGNGALTATAPGTVTVQAAYVETTPADNSPASADTSPETLSASTKVNITATPSTNIPSITWNAPAAITYGVALSSSQLSATANLPGTFVYSPAAGTVLKAGTQTLSVVFTPTDTKTYSSATATVQLSVARATPTISWPTPAAIVEGTALSSLQLDANANVPGSFAYNPAAGTIPAGGTVQLAATFSPSDTIDYMPVTESVSLTLTSATLSGQTAAVNMSDVYQPIDGFGGAAVNEGVIPSSVIDEEFSPTGIGLKFIRLQIVPDYADCIDATYQGTASYGGCVEVSSGATLPKADLEDAQAAVAHGAIVWATLLSPPGYMKTNGSYASGGTMIGNATNYEALAAIEASFVTLMTGSYGIPIYAISVQNEPEVGTTYPSCVWGQASVSAGPGGAASGAAMFAAFVPYLSRALTAAGYSNTKIMMAEPGHWNYDYMGYTMQQPELAPLVGIIAAHGYGGPPTAYPPTEFSYSHLTTQHMWETEVGDESAYDGSMVSGLKYALSIHNWLTIGKVNAWNYWELTGQVYNDNQGLTSHSNEFAKRAYVIGNWARFVTGMSEVAATAEPQSGVYVTAFLNLSTGASAIVAINTNSTSVSQAFTISGSPGPTNYAATPYITDPNNSLAEQSALNVSSNSFTADLTGSSVTTFVMSTTSAP
jgi:O-glycosyl hydrolase